ncbi:chemotaxis protein CheW [Nitrospira defluvii]|nr:chemotaxis protein CheW [Nitrospira defluvii]
MDDETLSILNEFLVECGESVGRLDQEFVELEKEPTNSSLIGSIFRTVHTIKGTCGFLGLPNLEKVSHGAENILSAMRDRTIDVTEDGITILLEAVDAIKEILEHIEAHKKEPDENYDKMRQGLDAFLSQGPSNEADVDSSDEGQGAVVVEEVKAEESQKKEISEVVPSPTVEVPNPETERTEKAPKEPTSKGPSLAEASIRVDVGLLDKLINMVGELVLARNQLLQQVRDSSGSHLSDVNNGTIQQLNLITTELQDTVMKTRMQPIKNVWDKFPRVIRDLARANNKEIELVMEGEHTELDKTLLEAIKDPMTHIVRNAADHGIELPDRRERLGKPAKGTLTLKAFHEGGLINIEISDDGAGIDVGAVKKKAVDNKIITQEVADQMSDQEVFHLIFHAGLSTAKKVTHVSGRGVGMDVVKTNIEKIGGSVEMSSRLGQGTQMRIKIPLTLAIIPALMVTSGGEPFAIPQASLVELVRINAENDLQIETIQGSDFYRLRGDLLPLIRLNKILKLKEPTIEELEGKRKQKRSKGVNIIILKAGASPFGLVVERVNDSEEIVVKPLSKQLKGLKYLSGATIMGDGRVALILDVLGIAQEGGLLGVGGAREARHGIEGDRNRDKDLNGDKEALLLFSVGEKDHYAIRLSQVARLEDIETVKVEQSGGVDVIQYRNELLPLVHLGDAIGVETIARDSERFPIIVFSSNNKSVGLIVGQIIDIVDVEMEMHPSPTEKMGVVGSIVIDGFTTDVLDADRLIDSAVPGWFEAITA